VKITKGKLKEIISEEVHRFVENMQKEVLQEGLVKPEALRSLLEQLDQKDGDR